ncbi:carboxymuconolactone decarboxylase family protein [Bordetella petrii]|uniref:Carboxymuconolactone decarboxylase family protein n=1 Tax=Bordetella petrii TaxID=94624 RepID=A0ABT7VZF9_9BORD|nr:carboxymuconolactone decarboxylase family protein [Bordetella petrii]MDM9558328.1 carboxymuconolactone decarboxylase family protein [Bordetella petrii]
MSDSLPRDALERGLANRREVLGTAWVERSVDNANALNVEFQRMITCYAWDSIWSRPVLDPRTRRIMVLAITASMGRWEEFELHVRTGLQAPADDPAAGALDLDTLREVLLQTAVYAGVPAGNTGMAIALKVLADLDMSPPKADFWTGQPAPDTASGAED